VSVMTENGGFVNLRSLRNVTRAGAFVSTLGKQVRSGINNPLPSVGSLSTRH